MALRKLYIFVEGNDDEIFFKGVIFPIIREKYDDLELIKYAQLKREKVDLFLLSIQTLKFNYVFTADKDEYNTLNGKRNIILDKYDFVEESDIIIVVTEIESWFLAGLSDEAMESFGIEPVESTEEITKEEFNTLYHRKFRSRIDFMYEIMKIYSIDCALEKNRSFNYFWDKFCK